jgi:hypothetical protein
VHGASTSAVMARLSRRRAVKNPKIVKWTGRPLRSGSNRVRRQQPRPGRVVDRARRISRALLEHATAEGRR